MIFDSKNFLYYYRLTPDCRMLFGGRAAFFPETANSVCQSAEILRRGMVSVHPFMRGIEVEYAWGGTLDFAFDIMPHAGELDGLFYALGYAGHGVAMATYLGTKMADVICGDPHANPFQGLPFPKGASRPLQRPPMVSAPRRGLVQVSRLGQLVRNRPISSAQGRFGLR
jgi:glycine/D-amino acid oxidase-like deaminating enzyme